MEIRYSEKAIKELKRVNRGDRKNCQHIIEIIEKFAANPDRIFDIKALKGKQGNFKRLRVGKYRIIFEYEGNTMSIYTIKHRREAYYD